MLEIARSCHDGLKDGEGNIRLAIAEKRRKGQAKEDMDVYKEAGEEYWNELEELPEDR